MYHMLQIFIVSIVGITIALLAVLCDKGDTHDE